jgi:hypothetical protein
MSRFDRSGEYRRGGRLVDVSRLRICEDDGSYAQAAAEVESGWMEWQAGDGGPEIELIAAATTVKAVEEMA